MGVDAVAGHSSSLSVRSTNPTLTGPAPPEKSLKDAVQEAQGAPKGVNFSV